MTEILNPSIPHQEKFSIPADLLSYDSAETYPYGSKELHIGGDVGPKNYNAQSFVKKTNEDVILFSRYKNDILNLTLEKAKNYLIVCAGRVTSNIMDTAFKFGDVIFVYSDSSLNQISFTGSFSVLEIGENLQPSIKASQNCNSPRAAGTDFISFSSRCLAELCKSLWEYDQKEIGEARNLILSMAMIGVVETQRHNDASKKSGESELPKWKFKKLEKYVYENMHRKLSNEELAAECGYSSFYFSRMFKNSCGMTPHQYVIKKRVDCACELLRKSNTPISAVSYDCGFSSQSHMTQIFRSLIGETPKSYRETSLALDKDNFALALG